MSKSPNKTDKSKANKKAAPGEQLRRAREARKFSIESVAERLHLAVEVIHALEKAEYSKLPAPTYIRGYLRAYATYVGLDGDQLVDEYNQIAGDMPPDLVLEAIPSAPQPGRKPDSTVVILSIIVVVALLALITWLSIGESRHTEAEILQPREQTTDQMKHVLPEQDALSPVTADTVISAPVVSERVSVKTPEQRVPVTSQDELPEKSAQTTPAVSSSSSDSESEAAGATRLPVSVPPQATRQPEVIAGQIRLSLAFDGSSWVEVHDASNKRLLMRLARAGSRYNISGKPPLRVLLGNARVVRLKVNDKAFSHQAYIRGKVARFDIQAGSE